MSGKKNKHKRQPRSPKSNFALGDILTTISGLAVSIMAIYGFIKAFREDALGFVWLIPLGFVIWLILLWQLFSKGKQYAYTLLILTLLAMPITWNFWQTDVQIKESKIIVLVAKFDGPEDKYGVRDELLEKLKGATKGYRNIVISTTESIVNSTQGSEYARQLGEKERADIVIWAWYRPTDNPNITIHIENLSPHDFSLIQESEIYQPKATIADLESFEIQKQIGTEAANLVNFLVGYLQYQGNNCKTALEQFKKVSDSGQNIPVVNQKYLFLYSGNCQFRFGDYDAALQQYDKVIQLDPNDAIASNNRGTSFSGLGQHERAIQDFDQAIQLDPNFATAYVNRGYSYGQLGQHEHAIQDFDQAIQLDPNSAKAYANRGYSYNRLGQLERAIQDFDKAIQLEPNYGEVYYNRGSTYNDLRQYELALQDLDKTILLDPNFANAYISRGAAYHQLGQYERAIRDFDQAIEINPQFAEAYRNRGLSYQKLGKTAEAEADFKKYEELTGQKP